MGLPASTKKCPGCGLPGLIRNGNHGGRTRWRCTKCGASTIRTRNDQAQAAQFQDFLTWIRGKHSQNQIDGTTTGRSLRRRLAWCWDIPTPQPNITGEIYDQIFIDGTYLTYQWCLLIARNNQGHVVACQWCRSETTAAYQALLQTLPPPLVATTDGAGGALKALRNTWHQTQVQRCLLHIHRNNTKDLTRNPKTDAGKALGTGAGFGDSSSHAASVAVVFMMASNSMGVNLPSEACLRRR